jgi:acetylornithine deacetylase/succinyl-diaminopimelate desuccinylase-like protein
VSGTGEGVLETADAVSGLIQDAGGSVERVETPGYPVLIGEVTGTGRGPRVVRYGMYDVQPAEEPDWSVPPFAAEVVDLPDIGPSVVCRGVANSKGSLAAFFCALEVLRDTGGVPVDVALMIEGEEELGSPNLPEVVRSRRQDLSADAGFDLDLDGKPGDLAPYHLGVKGLLSFELVAESGEWGGPARPLHSSEAAWIHSPVWPLVHALAALVGPDEELRVPALLEQAAPPTAADRDLLEELAETFDAEDHLREAGARRYKLEGSPAELLEALLFRPTINVDGLEAGYAGPGGKTIIPSSARAVLDVRLVPDMDVEGSRRAIEEHLRAAGVEHVELRMLDSYPWGKAEPGSIVERAIRASYERGGKRPVPYPLAPWCAPFYVFDRILGVPWVSGGLGYSGGAHGPDEFASVDGLREHIVGAAEFLVAFAELHSSTEPVGAG